MKWEGNRQSDNVDDQRGGGGGGGFGGIGGKTVGIGTIAIALIGSAIFGVDPSVILNVLSGGGGAVPQTQQQGPAQAPATDRETTFVRTVLADTEDTWTQLFKAQGANYAAPTLTLFDDRIPTACGTGQSASGPFYCPADSRIYIDLDFYKTMQQRFNVAGEFAQAYVIAHEVGHHVQHQLGISGQVQQAQQRASEKQGNALSVKLELQADCFAGVWAHHANKQRSVIEAGDVEAALAAATAIGDDALQKQSRGVIVPDSFTHGSSAQRVRWFTTGLEGGKVEQCNTFEARSL